MINKLITLLLRLPENSIKKIIRDIFYGEIISERVVEYALAFFHLGTDPASKTKILDIGCYFSNFPIQLASMGYRVFAIDLMDYQLTHPNFKFVKGDITKYKFPPDYFDIVTCISTLEHIGLGFYEGDVKDERGDVKTIKAIKRVLKKGGRFIFTVPFGKKSVNSIQRVYNAEDLSEILSGFRIEKELFYKEKERKWLSASKKDVSNVVSRNKTKAIVFISARKI